MSDQFVSEPRRAIRNIRFNKKVSDVSFALCDIESAGGKASVFERVDFSYSWLSNCYFHQAQFIDCKFVGTTITDSVFRSAKFTRCDFRYTRLSKTVVPYDEILENLPSWENIANDLIKTLKANAAEMGDFQYYNRLIIREIETESRRIRKAVFPTESYYKQKYGKAKRVLLFFQLAKERTGGFIWNHGYSVFRLVRFSLLFLLLLSLIALRVNLGSSLASISLNDIWKHLLTVFAAFIDLKYNNAIILPGLISIFIIIGRYFFFGMVVSIVFNRSVKR